jgi:hypothetical protein
LAEGCIDYTIAFRRAVRIVDFAGTAIEDACFPGSLQRPPTKRDLIDDNVDLLALCGRLLTTEPFTDLILELIGSTLRIETMHLDHIDVYGDGHPRVSLETTSGNVIGVTEYIFESPWYQTKAIGY